MNVTSEGGCVDECFSEDRCVSYNLGPFQGGFHICELSDSNDVLHPEDLQQQHGYLLRAVKVKSNNFASSVDIIELWDPRWLKLNWQVHSSQVSQSQLTFWSMEDLNQKTCNASVYNLLLARQWNCTANEMAFILLTVIQNPCNGRPCQQGAACLAGFTNKGSQFICPAGFGGEHCEHGKLWPTPDHSPRGLSHQ